MEDSHKEMADLIQEVAREGETALEAVRQGQQHEF